MESVIEKIKKLRLIPVIKLESERNALPLAEALIEGGLPCAEITFRSDCAERAIAAITKTFPNMLIGAGTLLTCDQADRAAAAGACFFVSPGLNPAVVSHCLERNRTFIPGIMTPSELETALSFGLNTVKFFPAEAAGGVKMIKSLAAPYGNISFLPTGGIGTDNVREYLSLKPVIACGGSWMAPGDLITSGDFNKIRALVRQACNLIKEIEI